MSWALQAQTPDTTTIKLDEIVIAENRIQLPFAEQSRSITLLDRELLQATPVISVADALRYAGGVDVRTRGVHGVQADIGIRGGTFDQTLVLINGIKISDPQTGHHSLNLPVDLVNVERVEVLKGPGARTFGQNAFSGAVNIVTARPKKSFLKIGAQGGDFALWGVRGSGAVVSDKQSHFAAVNYDQSAGYKHNTDYKILNAFYNGEVELGKGTLSLLGGFTDRAFGANGFYASPEFTEQYETIQTGLGAIGYNTVINRVSLEARAYYRQNNDEYIFVRSDPSIYQNNHTSRTIGLEVNTVISFKKAYTGIGIDLNNVDLESNNLGDRQRFVATLFLEHRMEFFNDRLDITPGVQLNSYSDFGFNALPGIDIGFGLTNNFVLMGNVGYTYRVPTFTDLYYTDPVNIGNPDLKPEFATNYELGVKTRRLAFFSGEVSFFYRDGSDMIDWVRATDSEPWQPVNILNLDMTGIDTRFAFYFGDLFKSPVPILNNLQLTYTFIEADAQTPESGLSRYALENLRHQLRAGVNLNYGSRITHHISYGYYDRVNLDDYQVVDTRLRYQGDRLGIFVDVSNIFDVEYQETNLVVMPGRWFKVGLDVQLF